MVNGEMANNRQTEKWLSAWRFFIVLAIPLFHHCTISPSVLFAKIVVVDTFDGGQPKNAAGGATGAWDMDPDDKTVSCVMSFDPAVKRSPDGFSLRLQYDLESSRQNVYIPSNRSQDNLIQLNRKDIFNGYYSILGKLDLTACRYLILWMKGDAPAGFSRSLKIELKDPSNNSGILVDGITDQWQQFVIPLRRFRKIANWAEMKEFVIVFGPDDVTKDKGAVYIDDVYFSSEVYERLRVPRLSVEAKKTDTPPYVDGNLKDWDESLFVDFSDPAEYMESGVIRRPMKAGDAWAPLDESLTPSAARGKGKADLGARFALTWDDERLYVAVDVKDDKIYNRQTGSGIWQDDCVEIYIVPGGDRLEWGSPAHFQLGITPISRSLNTAQWAWFQDREPTPYEMASMSTLTRDGYRVETAIRWSFLGIAPKTGATFGFTAAVHDKDSKDRVDEAKINWNYMPDPSSAKAARVGTVTLTVP
jgi:hypothetical protein